ncbi:MAG: hypothetical protein ACK5P6_07600 [Pseudobdellovibrionaceae bacterium]|jgi:hypothetical protein
MSKSKIDFTLMDRSKVAILCQNPAMIGHIVTQLEAQGKKVKVETSLTSFFSHLEANTPGFILVSRSVKTGMGAQLSGFLQRKFKTPVLTFSEDLSSTPATPEKEGPKTTNSRGMAVPEILHISEKAKPEEIISNIENFQDHYQKQLNRSIGGDLTRTERLEAARHAISENFASLINAENPVHWEEDQKLKVHSLLLKTPSFQGLSLFAAEETLTGEQLEKLKQKATVEMELHLGEKVQLELRELPQPLSWDHFQNTVGEFDQLTSGHLKEGQGLVAAVHLVEAEARPTDIHESQTGFHVPLEEWFTSQSLVFKLYLWLERSQKKVLYVKPGRPLMATSFKRFQGKGLKSVLIDKEDIHLYEVLRGLNKAS